MGNGASASHLSASTVVHLPQGAEVTFGDNAPPTCVASCSACAGMLIPGDVLLYCNGVPVSGPSQARKLLDARQGPLAPNSRGDGSLRLLIRRIPSTSCILLRSSAEEPFGLCMVTWGAARAVVGVEVQSIDEGSIAARAGTVAIGSIITHIDGQPVSTVREAAALLRNSTAGAEVRLELKHTPGGEWPRPSGPKVPPPVAAPAAAYIGQDLIGKEAVEVYL